MDYGSFVDRLNVHKFLVDRNMSAWLTVKLAVDRDHTTVYNVYRELGRGAQIWNDDLNSDTFLRLIIDHPVFTMTEDMFTDWWLRPVGGCWYDGALQFVRRQEIRC